MSSGVIANCCALQFSIEVYIDQRAKFNRAGSHSVHHFTMPYQRIYSENLDRSKRWYAYNLSITAIREEIGNILLRGTFYSNRSHQRFYKSTLAIFETPILKTSAIRRIWHDKIRASLCCISSIGNMFHTNSLSIPYLINIQVRTL